MYYKLEPDLTDSRLCYIYLVNENTITLKMTIYSDFDLARRTLEYLNNNKKK